MNAPYRFLVVDDDEDARFLHRHALERAFPACVVVEADGCESALHAISGEIHAVVADHHLRGEEGAECIRAFRRNGINCPVVMVTATDNPSVHASAYRAGVTKVFTGSNDDYIGYLRSVLERQ